MADIAMGVPVKAANDAPRAPRLAFIDNIRWSMIVLRIAIGMSDAGGGIRLSELDSTWIEGSERPPEADPAAFAGL